MFSTMSGFNDMELQYISLYQYNYSTTLERNLKSKVDETKPNYLEQLKEQICNVSNKSTVEDYRRGLLWLRPFPRRRDNQFEQDKLI